MNPGGEPVSDAPPAANASGDGEPGLPASSFDLGEVLAPKGGRGLGRLPKLLWSASRIVHAAAPRPMVWSIVAQVSVGVVAAVQIAMVRVLLGRLLAPDQLRFSALVVPLGAVVLANAYMSFSTVVTSELQRLIQELTGQHAMRQVLAAAAAAELIEFEDPSFHDRVRRAQINAQFRPPQMVGGALGVLSAGFTVLGVGAVLVFIQPSVVLLLLVGFGPVWFSATRGSRLSYRFSAAQARRDRTLGYIEQLLLGRADAKEVRAYDLASPLRARHQKLFDERMAEVRELVRRRLRLGLVGNFATAILSGATIGLLLWLATHGSMTLAETGTTISALLLLVQRLQGIQSSAVNLFESSLFIEDFTDFVARVPTSPAPEAAPESEGLEPLQDLRAEGVDFRYPGAATPVLDGVSLHIARGEVVALVGENGSGKTTLAKVLASLFEPSGGRLLWNGREVAGIPAQLRRDRVAVVFQDYTRLLLTVSDNITLGRWTASEDTARRDDAAARAGFGSTVARLPAGYSTLLGPEFAGEIDLSGGQWQRLALARSIFHAADLVILDEPTSALDPRSEAELFDRIRHVYGGAAVLLISHRFSTVRSADRIYVLDGGRVVEEGSHSDLLRAGGRYANLFELQASAYRSSPPATPSDNVPGAAEKATEGW